jgi:8-oxo-dGTP pyrophosphatase MutT (NUDIX family)
MPKVATSLLIDDEGKLLILKRSEKVKTYKGMWGGIAGYVEEHENPYETALKEIKEEVGLEKDEIHFIKSLDPIRFTDFYNDERYDWEIFAFLFKTEKKDKIDIDWEHSEYRWILTSEIAKYKTVPHLKEVVSKLLL